MLFNLQILLDARKGDDRELEDIEHEIYANNYSIAEKIAKDLIRRLLEIKKNDFLQLLWSEDLTEEQKQNNIMAYFIFAKQGSCLREKELRDSWKPKNIQIIVDKMNKSGWEEQGALFIIRKAEADNDKEYIEKMVEDIIKREQEFK